jgi:hypothetical protein
MGAEMTDLLGQGPGQVKPDGLRNRLRYGSGQTER